MHESSSAGIHPLVTHDSHEHVAAIFDERDDAIAAVDALRAVGLGSEHLGIAVRGTDVVDFEHDTERELAGDAAEGLKIGTPIGALAGLGLAALAVPGFGAVLGVGGVLAMAGVGALWGGLLGGYAGAAVGEPSWDDHQTLLYTALDEGQVLVVVCDHGRRAETERIFAEHGGRSLPLSDTGTDDG